MKQKIIKTHVIKNIWEAYADKLLAENPTYYGKYHNKIHNFFVYEGVGADRKEILSYKTYRKIIERFFDRAKHAIIAGKAIKINKCGRICARRVERDFRKKSQKRIDWKKTMASGKVWSEEKNRYVYKTVVYFTDDDWCRIGWYKSYVPNDQAYEFSPTYSNSINPLGFRTTFAAGVKANKFLKYQYVYSPIKEYPKSDKTCNTQAQV